MVEVSILRNPYFRWVIDTLAIAALYYISGKIGQIVAIPPSNITFVWPPSGIALALVILLGKRSLPGIFLGAYAVMGIGLFESGVSLLITSQLAFIGVGIGSTLQPLFGYFILNRFNCLDNPVESAHTTFKCLLLIFVICLVSSSVSVFSLCLASMVQWQDFGMSWFTWWFADSVGIFIFTPLVFLITQQSRMRILILVCLLIVGMSTSYMVSKTTRNQAEEAWRNLAKHETEQLTESFDRWLSRGLIPLGAIDTLIKGSENISRQEFKVAIESLKIFDPEFFPHAIIYAIKQSKGSKSSELIGEDDIQTEREIWEIVHSTEIEGMLSEGQNIFNLQGIKHAAAYAEQRPGRIIIMPNVLLADKKSYSPAVLFLHQDQQAYSRSLVYLHKVDQISLLVGFMDIEKIINDISEQLIPEGVGLRMTINHLNGKVVNRNVFYGDEFSPEDAIETFSYDFVYAEIPVNFKWDILPDYLNGPKIRFSFLILVAGILGTILSTIFVAFIFSQNEKISRRVAEQTAEISANEEQFRLFLDSSPEATLIVNKDAEIILSNVQVSKLFGYSADELLGNNINILIPERFVEKHNTGFESYLLNPSTLEMGKTSDVYGKDKQGREFLVEISLSPIKTSQRLLIAASIRDVTERKKTEQQLIEAKQDAEEKTKIMSKVFMDSADPIIIEDLDGVIIDANDEAVRGYGFGRDELLGQPIKILVPDEKHAQVDELHARCKAGEAPRNIEGERWDKSHNIIPVLITLSQLKDDAGKTVAIATIAKDITQQKLIEKELEDERQNLESRVKKRTQELKESEERLDLALKAGNTVPWDLDLVANITSVGDFYQRFLGFDDDEVSDNKKLWKEMIHPEDAGLVSDALNTCLERNEKGLKVQYRIYTKNRDICWIEAIGSITKIDEDGEPMRITGTQRNITEQKQYENELQEKLKELEEFNQLAVGRELRMIELKEEVNELLGRMGKESEYEIVK
jgi:PAS domain S-box-containing protein